jgi:hypothetical protein
MRNERGMVLPLTLIVMVVLSSLTLALVSLAAFEPLISRNLADGTQARFAAEAGIEAAFDVLASTPSWNTLLANASGSGVVTLFSGRPIGTLGPGRGVYTVALRNDTLPGDPAITGVTPVDTAPTIDANGAVILTSTGQAGGATRNLRVAVKRVPSLLDVLPAALAFPGNDAQTWFSGNAFTIDGRGWKMDGSGLDAGCASVFGISVSSVLPQGNPGGNEAVVEASLSPQQKDNVTGKKQNPGLPQDWGDNTVAPDAVLTPEFVKKYIDAAKQAADVTLESFQATNGLTFTNVRWGTPSNPQIVYVKGEADPTSRFTALQISGNSEGYGILIVEDGDLKISGNFSWHGPIIVTGQWVGVGFLGGGNQVVYGAIISNETATDPGFYEGVMTGNATLRYSCEALRQAGILRKLTSVANWKDLAPGE